MMPTKTRLTMLLSLELRARMSSSTAKAPRKAAMVTPKVDHSDIVLTEMPPKLPVSSTTNATPRLEPLLMPNSDGSAKGLRNKVCINKPETDNPMPASSAVMACGRRYSTMMEW